MGISKPSAARRTKSPGKGWLHGADGAGSDLGLVAKAEKRPQAAGGALRFDVFRKVRAAGGLVVETRSVAGAAEDGRPSSKSKDGVWLQPDPK